MPALKLLNGTVSVDQIKTRIQQLDNSLQDRVQNICKRLRCRDVSNSDACLRISLLGGLGPFMRWGVINELWPHLALYIVYTIGVQLLVGYLGWTLRWSATNQDSIYYPGLVL